MEIKIGFEFKKKIYNILFTTLTEWSVNDLTQIDNVKA